MTFDMTRDDAIGIVSWFSTDVGENFLEYLSQLGQGDTSDLMTSVGVDLYRAQGRAHQLRRVLDYLSHAEKVISGDIPSYQEGEGPDLDLSDPTDLGDPTMDDGSLEGTDL